MNGPKGKHAWAVKVGEKGQIVIPKQARDLFGIVPGESLLLLGDEKKGLTIVKGDLFAELLGKILGAEGEEADNGNSDTNQRPDQTV